MLNLSQNPINPAVSEQVLNRFCESQLEDFIHNYCQTRGFILQIDFSKAEDLIKTVLPKHFRFHNEIEKWLDDYWTFFESSINLKN